MTVFPSLSTVMVSFGFLGRTARKIATTVRMKELMERTSVRSKVQSSDTDKEGVSAPKSLSSTFPGRLGLQLILAVP